MFLKACELSKRVKSQSPESNILEEHREREKTGVEEGHRSTEERKRGTNRTEKEN